MSKSDRVQNAVEDLKGKATEAVGKITNDERKVREGKAEQASAKVKNVGADVLDALRSVKD